MEQKIIYILELHSFFKTPFQQWILKCPKKVKELEFLSGEKSVELKISNAEIKFLFLGLTSLQKYQGLNISNLVPMVL